MTSLLPRCASSAAVTLILALGLSAAPSHAAEPAIIAKARAYLGPENLLEGVKTLHFFGTLVTTDPADPQKTTRTALEIVFQKPDRQRIVATSDKSISVTGLDGYDAWQRVQSASDPAKFRQSVLGSDHIKRLRATTWESLFFFRGLEQRGGRVEDLGPIAVDGIACQKIAFIHAPKIVFYRCFDRATGHLVSTETETGEIQREQGEIVAGGIRFPRSVKLASKSATGQLQTGMIEFEKIILNETIPDTLFRVPQVSAK
jgi:hypothetical protein